MTVRTITCKKCGDTIFSRTRHDMRWCSCKSVAIDGGQEDYIKLTGDPDGYEPGSLEIEATKQDLYNDWNKRKDKFGLIKNP